jgi:gluconolactonase
MNKGLMLMSGALLSLGLYACESPNSAVLEATGGPDAAKGSTSSFLDITGLAAKNAELQQLGAGYSFTEGPAVDHFGNIFFTDQPNNAIHRWGAIGATKGQLSAFLTNSGRSNGMYFDADGYLITAADMNGEVWSIDENGNHTVLVDNYDGKILNGPNDIWIAPNGGMYITDPLYVRGGYWDPDDIRRTGSQQGGGYVYYLSPDRQSFTRVAGMDFDQATGNVAPGTPGFNQRIIPNGVVGTPDGKKLYVGHIWPEKTYSYDINPDGTLSNKQVFADMRSDGMTIDVRGNVYLTNEQGVTAFSPSGEKIFNVPTGEGWTANVVFGGPNRKTLFITALGRVYGLDMHVRGAN